MPTYPHDSDPWVNRRYPSASTHPADQLEINFRVASQCVVWMLVFLGAFAFEQYTDFSTGVGEITGSHDMQIIVRFCLTWIPAVLVVMCIGLGLRALFPNWRTMFKNARRRKP